MNRPFYDFILDLDFEKNAHLDMSIRRCISFRESVIILLTYKQHLHAYVFDVHCLSIKDSSWVFILHGGMTVM